MRTTISGRERTHAFSGRMSAKAAAQFIRKFRDAGYDARITTDCISRIYRNQKYFVTILQNMGWLTFMTRWEIPDFRQKDYTRLCSIVNELNDNSFIARFHVSPDLPYLTKMITVPAHYSEHIFFDVVNLIVRDGSDPLTKNADIEKYLFENLVS